MTWPQALPLALLRIRTKPQVKEELSPFEISYGRPYMIQNCTSNQVGEETLTGYIVGLQWQLKEMEKSVLGIRARGLDGPGHIVKPGDDEYVKSLSDSMLDPKWEGPFLVITSHTVIKVKEQVSWIHHTLVKKTTTPLWAVKEKESLKLRHKKI